MKRLLTLFFILFSFLIGSANQVQDVPFVSKGDLQFYVDKAAFRGSDDKTYVEFYLMFYAENVVFSTNSNQQNSLLHISCNISTNIGTLVSHKKWTTEIVNKDTIDIDQMAIYDQWAEQIVPGNYLVSISVKDQHSDKADSLNFKLFVPDFSNHTFSASQIEFVNRAEVGNKTSPFKKGNRIIIPNPSRRYGVLNPTIYIYYELYNIPKSEEDSIKIQYTIEDIQQNVIKQMPIKKNRIPGQSASILHGFDVSTIKSGVYNLVVNASSSNLAFVQLKRQFEVLQLDYVNPLLKFTHEQAEVADHYLRYLATPIEYNYFKLLNLYAKAKFLVNFWRERDPDPNTIENEFLNQIHQRYNFANENFKWGKIEGWNSDRGRILIQNGMPEEIEQHYSEAETVPYEVWYYHKDRKYSFIFADFRSNGNFVLIHSTKEGELFNDQWFLFVKRI